MKGKLPTKHQESHKMLEELNGFGGDVGINLRFLCFYKPSRKSWKGIIELILYAVHLENIEHLRCECSGE